MSGTGTDALIFAGSVPGNTANTEAWNGTSWTEVNNLATARALLGGAGATSLDGLAFAGYTTTNVANTEE